MEELRLERAAAESGRVVFGDLRQPSTLADAALDGGRPVIVLDEALVALHPGLVDDLRAGLRSAAPVLTLPGHEATKSLPTVSQLVDFFLAQGLGPDDHVVAVGGGTITDVVGFAASVTHRGVPHVRVPSTLLGQLDAAIGWKSGINHRGVKNVIGTFSVPRLTAVDVRLLSTLPLREVRSGLAEAVKVAIVGSGSLFEFLEANVPALLGHELASLDRLVRLSATLKVRLLEAWLRDPGTVEPMSLGHTVGHAVELLPDRGLRHGEAVAVGIAAAARLARDRRVVDGAGFTRIVGLLRRYGLPTGLSAATDAEREAVRARIPGVRCGDGATYRLVVPSSTGSVVALEDVTWPELDAATVGPEPAG